MEVNFLRLKNGNLGLFYLQKNSESTDCRIVMRTSADEGKTWINPKQLSPSGKYTGLTNGRSIRLSSGRILLEAWEGGNCFCVLSGDDCETWEHFRNLEDAPDDAWAYPAVTWIDSRALITCFNYKGDCLSLILRSLPVEWFYQ